jgi:hypothetical protein
MAYSAEISRGNPTFFVLMIDQSGSMSDAFGAESALRKADFVADVVNRTIHDLVIRCTRTEEIRNYYYLSVIGYGASVGPAFGGGLAGRTLIPVSDVAEMPARLENRTKKISDGAGGLVDSQVRFPVWMDAVSSGGTPRMSRVRGQSAIGAKLARTGPSLGPRTVTETCFRSSPL